MDEWLIILLLGGLLIAWLVCSIVLPIVAIVQVSRLRRELRARVRRLEESWEAGPGAVAAAAEHAILPGPVAPLGVAGAPTPVELGAVPSVEPAAAVPLPSREAAAPARPRFKLPSLQLPKDIDWELLIGQRGLGWLAVIVLIFSVAFFLRYAFENQWIGPLGRVSTGLLGGMGLVLGGWHYHRRGWVVFSQMVTAAGLVLLYLATYASFGFYRLIPQQVAAGFLVVLVVQAAGLAVRYDAPAIALMTLVGGLVTPLLMVSDRDQYVEFFVYLAILDAGVVLLSAWRHWRALALAALVGTNVLYWWWYALNYHPEKLLAALLFLGVIFALFLACTLAAQWLGERRLGWPELILLLATPFSYFGAVYVLLNRDYGVWLGSVAITMAAGYVMLCRLLLVPGRLDNRLVLASLAVVIGFIGLAFPIQANAAWVALGWAAEGAALWWFGCRVRTVTLRGMAGLLGVLAVGRLVLVDTPRGVRPPFVPIFNQYAIPALIIAACILGALLATRRFQLRPGRLESWLVALAGLAGILLIWQVLTVETHGYFASLALESTDPAGWRWTGQMAVSILWASYATVLLGIGMWKQARSLRWLALVMFVVTAGKVLLFDMAVLHAFYRILAFLVLAVLLGVAARAYQRLAARMSGQLASEVTSK